MTWSGQQLFVYGTLMPGESRWPLLEKWSEKGCESASLQGLLWDTGYGWPAMTAGPGVVQGCTVTLRPATAEAAFAELDAIEGVSGGLFVRGRRRTALGVECWVYEWPGSTDGFRLLDGPWSARKERCS